VLCAKRGNVYLLLHVRCGHSVHGFRTTLLRAVQEQACGEACSAEVVAAAKTLGGIDVLLLGDRCSDTCSTVQTSQNNQSLSLNLSPCMLFILIPAAAGAHPICSHCRNCANSCCTAADALRPAVSHPGRAPRLRRMSQLPFGST
jgi:hypothetical protein